MPTNHFLISWVFVLSFFHRSGDATRFLPMIVWDHTNPILKCKCNWLTIPKFDIYDKLDFVCPSLAINVDLMDGYSRPTAEMNVNIFRRKVKKTTDFQNLTKSLMDGSFCDPAESLKLHSCLNGAKGESYPITFKPEDKDDKNDYNVGDMFVFFNNGDDGKSATLSSMAKKCSMVFIVNVTWIEKQKNDMAYGKHLNPKDSCNNGSVPCTYECRKPTVKPPINPSSTYSTSNPSSVETSPTTESPTTTQCVVTTTQVLTTTQVVTTPTTQVVTTPISQVVTTPTTRQSTRPRTTSSQVFHCLNSTVLTCNNTGEKGSNEDAGTKYMYCKRTKFNNNSGSPDFSKRSSDKSDRFKIPFFIMSVVAVGLATAIVFLCITKTSKKASVDEKSFHNDVCVSVSEDFTKINFSNDEKTKKQNGVNNHGYASSPDNDGPKIEDCNTKDTKPLAFKDNSNDTGADNGGYSSSLERDEKKVPPIPPKDMLDDVDGCEKDDTYETVKDAYMVSPERNEKEDPAIPPKYILDVEGGYEIVDKYKKDLGGTAIDITI